MHIPFNYKIAPLLIAKYNRIMEFGKIIKYFQVKRWKKHIKYISTFPF